MTFLFTALLITIGLIFAVLMFCWFIGTIAAFVGSFHGGGPLVFLGAFVSFVLFVTTLIYFTEEKNHPQWLTYIRSRAVQPQATEATTFEIPFQGPNLYVDPSTGETKIGIPMN